VGVGGGEGAWGGLDLRSGAEVPRGARTCQEQQAIGRPMVQGPELLRPPSGIT
jgi:hypothetical protein